MGSFDESGQLIAENGNKKRLSERIASLTTGQRELYEKRLRAQLGEKPRIPIRQGSGPWPASAHQTALWFIQQLDPTTSAYNIGNGCRLRGKLDVALLETCLNVVVRRHEILRTGFTAIDGKPYQVVSDLSVKIPVLDVSMAPDSEKEARKVLTYWIKVPFDLEKPPLFRLPIVRLADDDHVLIGVLHHIITDWWSYHLFFSELFGIYRAFIENRPNPFPELPIQYGDWAAWRDEWEKSAAYQEQEAYWLRRLEGVPHVLELPSDHSRPAIQSHNGAREYFAVPTEVVLGLRSMNRQSGTSSFMTILGVLNVFLSQYTRQEDFLVGTPVSADRDSEETAGLIGYMLNTLVLRADLSGHPNFLQVLERVRTTCLDAFAHKEFPFVRLVERLRPERDLSRMPLYQVEYVYVTATSPVAHSIDAEDWKLPGFEIASFGTERNTSPVDLQIGFTEALDQLRLTIEYNSDIFEPDTVRRIGDQIIDLFDILLTQPERPISSVPLEHLEKLNLGERFALLEEFNPPAQVVPERTIPELIEAQVSRVPDRAAVIFGDAVLSYAELNRRANRMAHHFIGLGVGPEVLVGVCLERTPDMLVALLAVLKAGGAYLPMDPECPEARLTQILSDASPLLVVTTAARSASLAKSGPVLQMYSPETRRVLSEASPHNPSLEQAKVALVPQHPAYVIYTSGSTGLPKGVVIEHRSTAILSAWAGDIFSPEEWSGVLAGTAITFDLSVFELFVTLTHGGSIMLANSVLDLPVIPGRDRVRLINTVPSAASSLLDGGALPSCVQTVNLAGEELPNSLVQKLYRTGQINRIFNLYGPSEATTYSTFAHCSPAADKEPPIGGPIWNTRTYVLNPNLEPLAVGVIGELYIAGEGLARGYLNCPALTAERFLPDPYGVSGVRMYRTGDLARWTKNGQLEFVGRMDHQVKVRGYRIELGEIEAALRAQNGVAQAVVIVREDQPHDKRIAAYVIADSKQNLAIERLRQSLAETLPAYMLPAAYVQLDSLPLTPNGKVDRRRLPVPEGDAYVRRRYEEPRGAIESHMAMIWAEVLKVDRVGRQDNFFELGGHSLLAVSLMERLRQEGLKVDVRALFINPTLSALAARVGEPSRLIAIPENRIPDFAEQPNDYSKGLELRI